MKKKLFYLSLIYCLFANAQEETSNWYFGENAGIRFDLNSNSASATLDGQLNTREGCASISDTDGNLLFYTDGSVVYNKDHDVMQGGNGLLGDDSSTQSAIIVPKPGDPDIYYIFTVGSNLNPTGLNYSIVDITLDGGLGGVVLANNNLLVRCAEKISAVVKDCTTGSVWVITLSDPNGSSVDLLNTFHAFEVSETGVNNKAVTSTFGINILDTRGYLKISPNGTKLACANAQSGLYLFDFNAQTGVVSNESRLDIFDVRSNRPYGVEFSPNSQFLYISASNDFFGTQSENLDPINHSSILLQFNLSAGNIAGSQIVLDSRQLFRGGLQLGPDGKIYRALSATYNTGLPFLGVIENPNEAGLASNYVHNAIDLGGNNSSQGLPPFVQSFFTEKIDIIRNGSDSTELTLCEGDMYTLSADDIPDATYIWTRNNSLLSNSDYFLEVTESGNYEVTIEIDDDECNNIRGQAFMNFVTFPDAFNASLTQCQDGIVDGVSTFNLNEAFDDITGRNTDVFLRFYYTREDAENIQNGFSGNGFVNSTNPQTVYVEVINRGFGQEERSVTKNKINEDSDCNSIVELELFVSNNNIDNLNITVCDELDSEDGINTFFLDDFTPEILNRLPANLDLTVSYYNTYEDALSEKNTITGSSYRNRTPYGQSIFTRIENGNDCYGISEVQLTVATLPDINTEFETLYCLNNFPETISLDSGANITSPLDYTYNWSTNENTYSVQVNEVGTYKVIATNNYGCTKERTIRVKASNIATIESIEVVDVTQNNTVEVFVTGEGEYEYALYNDDNQYFDFQTSNRFENVGAGIYNVLVRDVKNNCGLSEKLVSVIGFPKFFTPNNDGFRDTWQVFGVSEIFQPNSLIYIYDRYGKLVKQLSPTSKGWDGKMNGRPLPNSDYWFAVTLQDGRVFKSHFTLKR